ncbi:hypothetical protein F5X98DRAFT_338140 [Xylaria grammica]|nr:hypothetical protein F5X98DRAFT_338140 [Xylaria grammica]
MADEPSITHQTTKAGEAGASGPASPRDSRTSVTATGLSVVYEPNGLEPILDVIFVHGLQGHPFKTWAAEVGRQNGHGDKLSSGDKANAQAESKRRNLLVRVRKFKRMRARATQEDHSYVFWPADLLPMELPRARILVFGYDTVVAKHQFAGAVNKNSIFAHSKDLVNELSRTRPLGRPVMFVTHSLGGIVIKESLAICSTSNSENIENILKSTTGVMFLGTPHRGSNAAGVGEIARKAASLLLMDTNSRVLDSLSLRNSDLERCQDVFSSLWLKYNFQVKTFQEGLPLKLPIRLGQSKMAKVVPDISSCLGDSRERAETLHGDHRSICRYTSSQDQNYKKVAAELQAVYTNLNSKSLSTGADRNLSGISITHDDQGKLEWLKFGEALFRQLSIGAPAENTCQWLPDTTSFKAWIGRSNVDSHLGLLQIIGKPGSGKSTLMKQAFEATRANFRGNTSVCVLGHFFDRRGQQALQHSTEGALRSLLYQLGIQNPASLAAFRDYTLGDLRQLESSGSGSYLNVLKSSLEGIFSNLALAPQRTIIFIDALDECDSRDALNTGYFLAQLTRTAYKNQIQLDVCIARREHPSITVKDSLEVRMETYNDVDIQNYIQQKFELASIAGSDEELLRKTVFQRSNGIFLWVVLTVEGILKDLETGENIKFILKRTESLPKTLEALYEQIIENMEPENRKMALRLFQWAVLATERLRIREWHHILAFIRENPPASLREWKDSYYYTETDAQLERRIRTLSQGLVEVKVAAEISIAASDSGSLRAGAGSLDSNLGDSRVVQPIHETVTEFFMSGGARRLYMNNIAEEFVGGGHLSIASTCLSYIGISELDGLFLARKRFEDASIADPRHRGRVKTKASGQGKPRRRRHRSRSATSFMSSASSHSGKYRLQSHDDKLSGDDTPPEDAASTVIDILDFEEELVAPAYVPDMTLGFSPQSSTPKDFAALFPSLTPFTIRHDNFSSDGNMNLVVDVPYPGKPGKRIQLFHLRMFNLSKREFSLRRYSRASGREISRSRRKYVELDTRPILQRSFKRVVERLSDRSTSHEFEPDIIDAHHSLAATGGYSPWASVDNHIGDVKDFKPADVIRLEFNNYSTIEIEYVSGLKGRTYQFSFWQREYTWNQVVEKGLISLHLFEGRQRKDPLASIIPIATSPEQIRAHEATGGWVPPHQMQFIEESLLSDHPLAEVVMSTGLTALVDGFIRDKFEGPNRKQKQNILKGTPALRHPPSAYRSPYPNQAENIRSISNSTLSLSIASRSFESQTLKEYPALTSYALNRVFVHAEAALAQGAHPGNFLRKLVLQNTWKRWYILQESAEYVDTWEDLLTLQGLGRWIDLANDMVELA